jgi:hypothetical protein
VTAGTIERRTDSAVNDQTSETEDFRARARARSEAKNEAARAALEPLAPGERPTAVTIAAAVAVFFAVASLVAMFFVDVDTSDERAARIQQIFISALLLVAAAGMWRVKYWAVLGFQTILGITVIVLFLSVLKATSLAAVAIFMLLIAAFSTQFWFLVRALARIQMPESPARQRLAEIEDQGHGSGAVERPAGAAETSEPGEGDDGND